MRMRKKQTIQTQTGQIMRIIADKKKTEKDERIGLIRMTKTLTRMDFLTTRGSLSKWELNGTSTLTSLQ